MENYKCLSSGRAKDAFRTFTKLVLADRLLEMRFGPCIQLYEQLEAVDFNRRLN